MTVIFGVMFVFLICLVGFDWVLFGFSCCWLGFFGFGFFLLLFVWGGGLFVCVCGFGFVFPIKHSTA